MQPSVVLAAGLAAATAAESTTVPGLASFVVPSAFPTSAYSSYYIAPGPTNEPQPVVSDPVLNITYPLNLTDPSTIPEGNQDPIVFPPPLVNLTETESEAIVAAAMAEVLALVDANSTATNCSRCKAALAVGQMVAQLAPTALPDTLVALCKATQFTTNATCETNYAADNFGAAWTQILAVADVHGLDGQYICAALSTTFCAAPSVQPVQAVFPKPRPAVLPTPRRSGKRVKVLHMSDLHLDARYAVGSEADCSTSLCCRPSTSNASVVTPAPLYGYYQCDSPYFLALAVMQAIGPLTGTSADDPLAMALYTGDLVAHDPQNELSHSYVEYVETSLWHLFKAYIGGPIYCALGNHDTAPDNLDAPHALDHDGPVGRQFSWNYDHVSALWKHYDWVDDTAAQEAALHYGAYSVKHALGVRIITINTDLFYKSNYYAFVQAANPDYSGIFSFLIDELQKAEDAGERVWIVGHVLSGWDGSNPLPNGSDLLYQIIDRYSPHVIANVFWGHTHEDQAFVYYNNNGTNQTAENAVANAWVGPSITPLTNLNSGFRLYEVDTGSWEVFDAYTFYADVNSFSSLNGTGPVFQFEYSTRSAYGPAANWPEDAPLNATFWHRVTEAMEADTTHALMSQFNTYQGKSSVQSPNCTSDACAAAKVCYMRSGSVGLGRQCPQGFASVQSKYTGTNF